MLNTLCLSYRSSQPSSRLLIGLVILLLGACSSMDDRLDSRNWNAEKLYAEARKAMEDGRYETAIQHYETLEAQYPFGAYAEQAILDSAYAYIKYKEPDTAIATAERFIKLHPRHQHVDYAYYLRGIANQSKKVQSLDFLFSQNTSLRDPGADQKSFDYYAELINKFPNSRYAPDARLRMGHLRNSLASHELFVARYYLRRKAPVAAANRAKYILEYFPQTPARNDALLVLVEAYTALDMKELAADARRVLELNNPEALKELKEQSQDAKVGTDQDQISGSSGQTTRNRFEALPGLEPVI